MRSDDDLVAAAKAKPNTVKIAGTGVAGFSGDGGPGTAGQLSSPLSVAYDANTGKRAWRFHTVAGPGEPGGDTWPPGDAYLRGVLKIPNTASVLAAWLFEPNWDGWRTRCFLRDGRCIRVAKAKQFG